ncbi:MAG TPA: metal ABC transporter substrate-binding protein [Gemmatimonadaceae bacterium]|nr:metal ABC transporter substrate-binding protein [Gemmatimonadaceae bacterium]
MMNRFLRFALCGFALGATASSTALAQLKVVTSTTDLWDIARAVGGNHVKVTSIGKGYEDPHFVQPKPSFILQLRSADVWAYVGLDLEIGWMPLLLDGARNSKIRAGAPGHINVSTVIPVMDANRAVDRSQGDVHPLGNPHYWLDPNNARKIAGLFRDRFSELDPKNSATYRSNTGAWEAKLSAAEQEWRADLASIKDKPIVAWHTSWRYFAAYTGLRIVGFMEPKPGVPPSPSHLSSLVATMKQTGAKAIIMEPFYDRKTADKIARETGAKVLVVPPSVGGAKGLDDYIELMKANIRMVAAAVR